MINCMCVHAFVIYYSQKTEIFVMIRTVSALLKSYALMPTYQQGPSAIMQAAY